MFPGKQGKFLLLKPGCGQLGRMYSQLLNKVYFISSPVTTTSASEGKWAACQLMGGSTMTCHSSSIWFVLNFGFLNVCLQSILLESLNPSLKFMQKIFPTKPKKCWRKRSAVKSHMSSGVPREQCIPPFYSPVNLCEKWEWECRQIPGSAESSWEMVKNVGCEKLKTWSWL